MSMNRTLSDGRPVLSDAKFPAAHNIHGTTAEWTEETRVEERAFADLLAKRNFLEGISGDWFVDIEKTRETTSGDIVGEPQQPVILTMKQNGAFEISAQSIVAGSLSISITAEGSIDLTPVIIEDRLKFDARVESFNVTSSSVKLAGFDIPGLAEIVEGIVKYFKVDQKVDHYRSDEGAWLRIESDTQTLMLARDAGNKPALLSSASLNRNILPTPRPIDQGQKHLCWAAAIACLMRILRTANREPSIVSDPSMTDPYPQYTLMAVVDRVEQFAIHNPKLDISFGQGHRLKGIPDSIDDVCAVIYGLPRMKKFLPKALTIQNIKAEIDQNRFVFLAYSDPKWITPAEPLPSWHAVVVYGYDLDPDLNKILIADSNGPVVGGFMIDPRFRYLMTSQSADTWDEATKSWIDEPTRVRREQDK